MEHTEATESMAAERYLLGEMTPEDRDAFEEHFFGCAACAADVRDGAMIRSAIRTEKANRTRQPRFGGARQWLTAAALAAVVGGVPIVQNVALRQQLALARAPHIGGYIFLSDGSRGGEQQMVSAGSQPFTIDFEIPPQPNARRYVVQVVDAAGKVRSKDVVSAEAARNTQHLLVPGGSLPPGRYSLEVHAEPAGSPATVTSFIVR
jgi:putative zinc finger protein